MSLLIKALDKAQEANAKQGEKPKKAPRREPKSLKADVDHGLDGGDLSLAEPGSQLGSKPKMPEPVRASKPFNPLSTQELLLAEIGDIPATRPKPKASSAPLKPAASTPASQAQAFQPQVSTTQTSQAQASASSQAKPMPFAAQISAAPKQDKQDRAANVFSAKRTEQSNESSKLALLAGVALLALAGIGIYFYQAWQSVNEPPLVVVQRPAVIAPAQPPLVPQAQPSQSFQPTPSPAVVAENKPTLVEPAPAQSSDKVLNEQAEVSDEAASQPAKSSKVRKAAANTLPNDASELAASNNTTHKGLRDSAAPSIASASASINVTKSRGENGLNPTLMRAYEAYNAGNDSEAQTLYKQVLQRDIRNVDALLGLGAIATRQGRDVDANGWYQKVLELEPRNPTASEALSESQPQTSDFNSEQQLKSLIQQTPNDANLHTKLGNFYADQNQWRAAQQAYFEAFRLNNTAENAYNLGVSLDQMGKPKLALTYYRQTLELMQPSTRGVDETALQARIDAIQLK